MSTHAQNVMSIKVAIVEDDRATREMLSVLLQGSPGFCCVASCESAECAVREVLRTSPDVALIDLELPGKSGTECIRLLRRRLQTKPHRTCYLVLTNFDDPENVFRAIQAGAHGYLTKRTPPSAILEAIRDVHEGGAPMTPHVARRVLQSLHDPIGAPPPGMLTTREREVLTLAAKGMTYQRIADTLGTAHGTIRKHFHNLYEKLHVHSLGDALRRTGIRNEPTEGGG